MYCGPFFEEEHLCTPSEFWSIDEIWRNGHGSKEPMDASVAQERVLTGQLWVDNSNKLYQ